MARGSQQAQQGATTGLNFATSGGASLMPELQQEAINPQGMNPTDMARANTTVQQSAGGTQAGATGEGALLAARTKNPGAAQAAISESARTGGQEAGKNALGIQLANTKLKQQQQQAGQTGLENLTLGGLGDVAPNVNANTGAINASYDWAKDILDPALQAAGSAAAGLGK